jgi:hypothetical protein
MKSTSFLTFLDFLMIPKSEKNVGIEERRKEGSKERRGPAEMGST